MKLQKVNGEIIEGTCRRISENIIEVTVNGAMPGEEDIVGFRLLRDDEEMLFDSEEYTTVYRTLENGYQLSNNGDIYAPPAETETEIEEPTLEELKKAKKELVGQECEQAIYAGVTVPLMTGAEHFSLTEHDQINLFGKQAQLAAGVQQLEYHQDGQPCRYYTAEEMQAILEAAMFHVSYHTTYCNSLNMWIDAAADDETLEGIFYGADIPEEHQSIVLQDYLSALAGEAGPEPGPEPEEGEGNQEEDGEIEEGN